MGWEEEKLWKKNWKPPKELLGPNAHKSSTLAGKAYKTAIKKTSPTLKSSNQKTSKSAAKNKSLVSPLNNNYASTSPSAVDPLSVLQQLANPLLFNLDTTAYTSALTTNLPVNDTFHTTPSSPSISTSSSPAPHTTDLPLSSDLLTEKDRILFALQFGQKTDVEWALDEIVTISFEFPEKLDLCTSPFLLQLLVSLAQPCLVTYIAENALPNNVTDTLNSMLNQDANDTLKEEHATGEHKSPFTPSALHSTNHSANNQNGLDIILKVLHILRNFSFLNSHNPILAKHAMIKELLVQGLQASMSTGHVELGRHSIDVLENVAAHMELTSSDDSCLQCIQTLVAAHDRYLVIGSIRTLTWLTMNKNNHTYLIHCPVITRVSQMLLSNDEELVGTSLEYIYQHTRISHQSRSQFLTSPNSNAYVGLLVSLLMTKSKYFCTRFVREDAALPTPNPANHSEQPAVPRVPDLTEYQKLDEPFRCLGW